MTETDLPVSSFLSNGEFLDLLLNLEISTVQTRFGSIMVKLAISPTSNLGIGRLSILRGLIDNFIISSSGLSLFFFNNSEMIDQQLFQIPQFHLVQIEIQILFLQ